MLSSTVFSPMSALAAKVDLSSSAVNSTEPPLRMQAPIILPDMGDASSSDLSTLDEKKLGEQIMREIRKDPDYSRDFVLYDYYNQIGRELVNAAKKQKISGAEISGPMAPKFEFFGVRDQAINAFALPGGYIGINSGLVVAAENESEMASVMGHEIGHITQKHIARSMGQDTDRTLVILASLLLAALAAKGNPNAAQGIAMGGQAYAIQDQLSYSRSAEREADRVGFQILQAGGFDVNSMATFFQKIQRASNIMESGVPSFVRTHPLTIERISEMQDRARAVAARKIPPSLEFYLMQTRAKVEQHYKSSEQVELHQFFDAQVQSASPIKVMQGNYGLSLLALRENKYEEANNYLKKSRDVSQSIAAPGSPITRVGAPFDLVASEIALRQKKYDQAISSAQQVLRLNLNSKAAGIALVEAYLASGKIPEAVTWLKQKTKIVKDDSDYWGLLAQAYAIQNKRSLHHAALAEKFAIEGGLLTAIEQLKIAKQANDADFYQMSEIDARARQFQQLFNEEQKDASKKFGR